MDFFGLLTMLGGLALFLYGMHAMGEGLTKVSGGKLEHILEKLTSSPLKAVALGAIVTGVIQSSSATTVMVVGFVNSGMMKLSQAIGVIMGANIGTTVTSWILSLSGIDGDSFLMQMLKPSSFAPILALMGVILVLFTKKSKKKDVGTILVGFAILMIGMETMSGAVKPLADEPAFTQLFVMFSNPFIGLLVGAIVTAVIQSSSASVGILQALCLTGMVPYASALPIIMGQNIGTCITAILSSIGTCKNARRAALIHLYFNLIGITIFMIVFYLLNAVIDFNILEESATPAGVATIHSIFNISATIMLLPFASLLEKLAYFTIKEDESETTISCRDDEFQLLDERFLETPSFAVEQCRQLVNKMGEISKEALFKSIEVLQEYNEEKAESVKKIEERVDHYEDELGNYLVRLSSKNLSEKDSHLVSMFLHLIGDYERISDHAVNIMEAGREIKEKRLNFSEEAKEEMLVFAKAVKDIVNISLQVIEDQDKKLASTVEPLEEVIDHLKDKLKGRHIQRLREGKCTIELGFVFSDIITNYERVSDHCSNIALYMLQLNNEESFDAHEYMEQYKREDNEEFKEKYLSYKMQYKLPS